MTLVTKVTFHILVATVASFMLGTIPIARANLDSKPTTMACTTISLCPKTPKICNAPVGDPKPEQVIFAALQAEYVPPAPVEPVVLGATAPVVAPATPETPIVPVVPGFDASGQNNPDLILQLINAIRTQAGLPAFEKNDALCAVAESRTPEIPVEVANGRFHSGLHAKNLPYWITENMKYGSNDGGTVQWWMNSPIHHAAIMGNSKYSCGKCVGNACIQLFTSFEPK
ncbi:MAG: hypothetical protein WBO77_02980 [Microgenomates group bacterium]